VFLVALLYTVSLISYNFNLLYLTFHSAYGYRPPAQAEKEYCKYQSLNLNHL